ncbi:MAG: hypothetical protein K0S26_509 [Bacteroidota bacterium]|nr:hypothetical protein [Bacteroidota bacterium]
MWINYEKQIESTGITRLKYLLINSGKLSLVIVPVVYLTFKCVDYAQEYQLKKYGVLSKGIITNITIIENEKEATYHADFTFSTPTKDYTGFSVIDKNEYQTGDSVFVQYSNNDLDLTRLKGKINRLN